MTRPERKHLALALMLALAAVMAACGEPRAPERRPNVLIVVLDTVRGDRCSVNGYERPTTPVLEALAREGVRYSRCWSPSPWTAPAHASLFTGLRPARHGLLSGTGSPSLAPGCATLAERLRDGGYRTAAWSANYFVSEEFGLSQGFERFWGSWTQEFIPAPVAAHTHGLALSWMLQEAENDRPFFVFINDTESHAPYEPLEPHRSRFLPEGTTAVELARGQAFKSPRSLGFTLGVHAETPRDLAVISGLYDGALATVDATLEPLFEGLRAAGVLDDTIVIVTSDHGENLGERHMAEHVFSCNRSLLHVPLVIRYPPAFEPDTTVDDVVRLEDLFPTVLDLCGIAVREELDAVSLLRELPGRNAIADYGRQVSVLAIAEREFPGHDLARFAAPMRSVFDGTHHFIEHADGRDELYRVADDPLELHNLAKRDLSTVRRLRALLGR